jgi:N6-L-threonylcarbamoyladenine synthase
MILQLGYPGGPAIERVARDGDAKKQRFTRPMLTGNQKPGDADYYDFSFSGLKTAVLTRTRELQKHGALEVETANIAAAFQSSVIDVLVGKTMRAVKEKSCRRVLIGGGVAASKALRSALAEQLGPDGELFYPSTRLATDNGAMIARTAVFRYAQGDIAGLDLTARADMPFPGLRRAP